MRRKPVTVASVTAIVVGCIVAVSVPLVYAMRSSDGAALVPTFGSGMPTRLAGQRPITPAPASIPTIPGTLVTRSTPVRPRPVPTAAPTSLTIGSAGIAARVVAVGVDGRGGTVIPERVDTVGWYRFGPRPGAGAGSVVLVGHVDSAQQGEGAFFRLRSVRQGAVVSVSGTGGRLFRYRVVGRQEYPKTSVPLAALFSRTGAPRLTLITCGGSFDRSVRHYRDNIVVTAIPIGSP